MNTTVFKYSHPMDYSILYLGLIFNQHSHELSLFFSEVEIINRKQNQI